MTGAWADWALFDPWFLLGIPVVWSLFAWRLLRARAALPTASAELFEALPKSVRARFWYSPLVLQALALSILTVALARPVTRDVLTLRGRGVDIVLVLDVSSSMLAPDMEPVRVVSRIEAARTRAIEFARNRVNDRVGLLTFARYPELRCPLTLDQEALAAFIRQVDTVPPRSLEDGTGIGAALAKAVTLFEGSRADSRIVVLLSDGENNVEDILPEDAVGLAKDAGVVVHCIGLGGVPSLQSVQRQVRSPEFTSLNALALQTGGQFFAARSSEDLKDVYARIDEMEKAELEDPRFRSVDQFLIPLTVGSILLLLQLLVEFGWIRRVP